MARFTREQIEAEIAAIDWSRFDRLTDAEIEAAVANDPDAAPIRSTEDILATAMGVLAVRLDAPPRPAIETAGAAR